ncbi:type VII secretion-associated serine protease mycosin [Streptomyces sp. NPDC006670]|uniref:type VII secretion-associated serine protease mycosin n=1 Tax=Streptomyces sp. NPDC006670 TaxID=3154476 RepID=UPI0033CE9CDD
MRMQKVTSALVGLLLAGLAATSAHAETVRSKQWYLDAMKADDIWKISTGKGVTVAVIDTGVARIPELEGQVLPGKDFAPESIEGDERTDYKNHGTTMASLIVGNGKGPGGVESAFGLAPDAKVQSLRVDMNGNGISRNTTLADAIRFAADSEAKILNISLGWGDSEELRGAVRYALDKGKLIFAASGNDGGAQLNYPAGVPGVVGVGAIGSDGAATKESTHNVAVDLAAPGFDIIAACSGGTGLCTGHGTSDATALTSASAALLWSAHPTWTNNQVLRVLLNTAGKPVDGVERNDYIGYGVVRPRVALPTPGDPGPPDVYPLPDLAAAGAAGSPPPAAKITPSPAPKPQAAANKGGGGLPWLALGLGACVLIGGAVTAVVVRRAKSGAQP